jgi:hypothetical protein
MFADKSTAESEKSWLNSASGVTKGVVIQRKVETGAVNDPLEHEADAVAEKVMRMVETPFLQHNVSGCTHEESVAQQKELAGSASGVQKSDAPMIVHNVLASTGQPLDTTVRTFMERRFIQDFSNVRVHNDAKAAESARAMNAHAYTVGRDVVFGAGEYRPATADGKRLLAHELAHVVQQEGSASSNHPTLFRSALYQGNILDEGSCEHLTCNSKWAVEDNEKGIVCPAGTRNFSETIKYKPSFTCDQGRNACLDDDHWMAIPKSRFTRAKCNQNLVICANGNFTTGYVRDRSIIEAWEVSHGIQDHLGVRSYATFNGSIYGDENDPDFKNDGRCHPL